MPGSGSIHSPINVDDSEDEITQELTSHTPASCGTPYSGSPIVVSLDIGGPSVPTELESRLTDSLPDTTNGGQYTGALLLNTNDQLKHSTKRKRSNSVELVEGQPPNKHGRTLEDRLTNPPLSKNARKKQNKAQKKKRIQEENLRRLRHHPDLVNYQPPTGLPPRMWVDFPTPGPYNGPYSASDLSGGNFFPNSMNWVESMVWSTSPGLDMSYPMNPQYTPPEPDFPPPNLPPTPTPASIVPVRPIPTGPKAESHAHALPPKPPPYNPIPIGMQPDQDPNSKHGIFKLDGQDPKYLPNPARTLVMEQLPKSHRSPDFVNSWGRKAAGAQPVKVLIDSPAAKALVEFSTAEIARKAWESPRLGSAYVGLKSHQLKGKPREDLIRVWWYRVDGVGAASGVGEIEEGEIADDAQEPAQNNDAREPKITKDKKKPWKRVEKVTRDQEARLSMDMGAVVLADSSHHRHASRTEQHVASGSQYPHPPTNLSWNSSQPSRPQTSSRPHMQVQVPTYPDPMAIDGDGDDMDLASPIHGHAPMLPAPLDPPPPPLVSVPASRSANIINSASGIQDANPVSKLPAKDDVKAILTARHKQLEEQIAKTKFELAQRQASASSTMQPPSHSAPPTNANAPAESKEMLESRLRERVLQTQKAKQLALATSSKQPSIISVSNSTVNGATEASSNSRTPSFSFEDMADNFIAQTIEIAKDRAKTPPERPTSTATASNNKVELELKRKRLEEHISRTKLLMEQLEQAKSKEEKDILRAKIKDLDRQRSEELADVSSSASETTVVSKTVQKSVAFASYWPQSKPEDHVFYLTEDEDEDD